MTGDGMTGDGPRPDRRPEVPAPPPGGGGSGVSPARPGRTVLLLLAAALLGPRPAPAQEAAAVRDSLAGEGYRLVEQGRAAAAAERFEAAVAVDSTADLLYALAYARGQAGQPGAAVSAFEAAHRRRPAEGGTVADIAWAHLRAGNEPRAARWLREAIDGHRARDAPAAEVDRLRRTYDYVTRRVGGGAYLSWRDEGGPATAPGGVAGGTLPSQAGVDATWRPPGIGYDRGRILEAYARLLWGLEPGSLRFDEDSYQGGVGVRYKPLADLNLFVSGERLFSVGSAARDAWMGRVQVSDSRGMAPLPGEGVGHYSTVYGDAAAFSGPGPDAALFAEVRQGVSVPLGRGLRLAPHVAGYGRWEEGEVPGGSYLEAGPGVSLRAELGSPRYRPHVAVFELLVQYRWTELEDPGPGADGSSDGPVVTGVLRF